jgi:hypothetical protein
VKISGGGGACFSVCESASRFFLNSSSQVHFF